MSIQAAQLQTKFFYSFLPHPEINPWSLLKAEILQLPSFQFLSVKIHETKEHDITVPERFNNDIIVWKKCFYRQRHVLDDQTAWSSIASLQHESKHGRTLYEGLSLVDLVSQSSTEAQLEHQGGDVPSRPADADPTRHVNCRDEIVNAFYVFSF